jgi:hypothetical protein
MFPDNHTLLGSVYTVAFGFLFGFGFALAGVLVARLFRGRTTP